MSSSPFSVRLRPDAWLRLIIHVSGRLMAAVGVVMILTLDFSEILRLVACLGWLAWSRVEIAAFERSNIYCHEIILQPDGSAIVKNTDGEWRPAVVLSGSFVLGRTAWLRLKVTGGPRILEWLLGDASQSHDWRRLQVLRRHIGAWR